MKGQDNDKDHPIRMVLSSSHLTGDKSPMTREIVHSVTHTTIASPGAMQRLALDLTIRAFIVTLRPLLPCASLKTINVFLHHD